MPIPDPQNLQQLKEKKKLLVWNHYTLQDSNWLLEQFSSFFLFLIFFFFFGLMSLKLETESPLQMWAVPSLNPNTEPHPWTVKEEKMVEDGRPIVQRDK